VAKTGSRPSQFHGFFRTNIITSTI
jgi:hypothetical protein